MSILDMIINKQPSPPGAFPQRAPQPQPAPISTGSPVYQAPQPSFFERLGSGAMDYLSDPTNRARMAAGFNTMRLNPDPNIARMAQSQIETQQAMGLLKQQGNQTAKALKAAAESETDPERKSRLMAAAALIEQNPSLAKSAASVLFERPQKPSAFSEKVDALIANGMSREEAVTTAMTSGGTTINMPSVGTIPPGYRAAYDDAGRVVSMEPVPGGPVATEVETTEEAAEKNYQAYQTGIANLSKAFGMANTGSLVGLAPALTSGDLSFEGMRDVMLQPLKAIFRGKGEGTFTDADAAQLLNMMPTRRDTPESAAFKLQAADQIIRAKLGLPMAPVSAPEGVLPGATKRFNPQTGKVEDI